MIFSLVILFLISRLSRARDTRSDFYTGDRTFTAPQNGLALFGTFMMMTSFLTLGDGIALSGYDGVLPVAGFAVSWLTALLLVAEPLRNTGGYTLGDALSVRMRARPVRLAAAVVTLVVFVLYMAGQLVAASGLLALLVGLDGPAGQALIIATISGVTLLTVYHAGMRGTTWTQIINALLLFTAVALLAWTVLSRHRLDASTLLGDATMRLPAPDLLESLSGLLTTVLGHAVLPYFFIRFLTVPDAKHARRSVSWAIWLTTPYSLLIVLIGFGAAVPDKGAGAASLLVVRLADGPVLVFVASVVFTTIIGLTAGLALSAAASFTRDVYTNLIGRGPLDEAREIAVARRTVVVLCLLPAVGAILLMRQNVTFLLSFGITLAASTILPTLLYAWFWRGFNTMGALWSMYGGAAVTTVLVMFSPAVSGDPLALFPGADFALFPWRHVGLVSIPLAFLLGYAGAKARGERDDVRFAEMEVRALTGAGAAEAVPRDPDDVVPWTEKLPWGRRRP
ncbi:cation acetate symporter [Nonomuraea endophytica]|uniref:cation acetate symporter n=1 Tax=Nonomuraea endophytica TaxID=714136 RepID=UPI0037C63910